jgi:hypothetical protein
VPLNRFMLKSRKSGNIRNDDRNSKFSRPAQSLAPLTRVSTGPLESMLFHHHEYQAGQCRADAEGQRERTQEDKHRSFRICAVVDQGHDTVCVDEFQYEGECQTHGNAHRHVTGQPKQY